MLGDNREARAEIIERLHIRHAAAVFDKCRRMLTDAAEAEDAVQETFVTAYHVMKPKKLEKQRSALPWLYRIATHVCLHALRTRRRKGLLPIGTVSPGAAVDPGDLDRTLELRRVLHDLMLRVDKRSQHIFVAYYIDGMTQGEIAKGLGISRRTVINKLNSLRARFARIQVLEACHE